MAASPAGRLNGAWRRLGGSDGLAATLARGGAGSLVVGVAAAALALAVQLLLTRLLGVRQYGIYIYAISWLAVLGLVARLGLDSALIRFVAVYRSEEAWAALRGLLRTSTRLALAAGLAGTALAAAVVWWLEPRIEPDLARALWIAALAIPLLALVGLRQGALRGLRRVVLAQLPETILVPALLGAAALVLLWLHPQALGGAATVTLHLAALTLSLGTASLWLRRSLPPAARAGAGEYRGREWIQTSLPLLFISGMAMVLAKTDVLMIGVWIDTTQAGSYAVAARLARLVTFGLAAATAIAAPLIAESYARGERQRLQRIARLSALGLLAFTLPVALILAGAGRWLLALFDPTFVGAYGALLFLLAGHAVNSLSGSVSFFMTMTGHQIEAASVTGVAALTNVVLNAVLIPRFGLAGAGFSTAFSIALMNLCLIVLVRRRVRIDPTVLSLLRRRKERP